MYNWKSVPLPDKMKDLPRDKRGYPVPFIILRDKNGYHFKINDSLRVQYCKAKGKCAICGNILGDDSYLIGGVASAFHKNGRYIDTPVHKECGDYALRVCPFLAIKHYNSMMDVEKVMSKVEDESLIGVDYTVDPNRPAVYVMLKPKKIEFEHSGYIRAKRPFKEVIFYDGGKQIDKNEAWSLVEQDGRYEIINKRKFRIKSKDE